MFQINPWLIAFVVIVVAAFFVFAISRIVRAHRRQPTEDFAGKTAVVRKALNPEGMVLFEGELWEAVSEEGNIEPGAEVTVVRADGLKLKVKKKEGGK